tara:strand:- start:3043 stop:3297 length:255 start_codon:yes stop_codon:yes gene_type:complete
MTTKSSGYRKLSYLVPNHIFINENWDMLPTVMDLQRQANKIWRYQGTTRPCFNGSLVITFYCLPDLLHKMQINKWTFFKTTWHS